MTLNFPRRELFPNYSSEEGFDPWMELGRNSDGLGHSASFRGFDRELENTHDYRWEKKGEKGVSCELGSDGFGNSVSFWGFDWGLENSHDYRWEKGEKGGSCELGSDDILDLLPADPFEMDIRSTFTAITGWFEDVKDFRSDPHGFRTDEAEAKRLFAGLNLVWNSPMRFQPEMGNMKVNENSTLNDSCNGVVMDNGSYDSGFLLEGNLKEFLSFGDAGNWVVSDRAEGLQDCTQIYPDSSGGPPHDALFFALGYLGVRDLLSVERVCRSLCDAVKTDPLLWRSISIDQPLSEKITDDALVQLTSRAQGTLQCLSLVECLKITDNGLKCVLESNPGLKKLSVPGCVRLTVAGILFNLKAFKSAGTPGIKHLRIAGISDVTNEEFEELKFLLGADNHMPPKSYKPRFYRGGHLYLSSDDDRAIDIEACPKCQKLKLIFDCPAESCRGKHHTGQLCRACVVCIARCIHCGRCIKDCDYEETFCLELLCLDCWKELLNFRERLEEKIAPSSKHTIFHQETNYPFCLYG
ncbi:hypothetical protein L1049_002068 [Liquidambar formosana]|uniref:F-box domain-containing protein n=1 Tax=Liquidambar formosana TaxID=63359 RepID=A0AAP0NEW7_LIQFO